MDTKQLITGNPKEGFYPIVQDTVTVIELNEAVMNLTSESSSEDIAAAFDSAESFNDLIENIRNSENIVNGILMNNDNAIGKIICSIVAHKNQYACDIEYIYDSKIIRLDITNTDGTMSCIRKETELGGGSQNNIKYISLNNIPDGTGTVNEDIITTLNTLQDRDILIGILDESKVAIVINYYMVNSKFYGYCILPNWINAENTVINSLIIDLNTKESSWNDISINTNGDGTKFLSDDGKYKAIEVGDKTNVLILSLENDLANGQKDSSVNAEVSTALKDAISNGKACVIKSANSDILANLQQISDNVTIVMEQISRVGQTFVAVNTTITVNTVTNVISDYQTGALVLETEGDGNKFLSNNGEYKEIPQPDLSNYLAKNNTTAFTPDADYEPATKKYVDDHNSNYAGGILNIGENNVSYDEDIINYGYLVIFLSGFGNITIPIRVSGGQISEYSTLISISDSVGVGESAYSLARVTMSNLTKNANKYEGTINVAYLHRIIRESDYNDLGTVPETDDILYFVIPD